jgi:flagellar biosynthetic protein FliO
VSTVDIFTTILPLFLIVGLLYAALLFIRKSGLVMGKNQGKISQMKIISTQSIMHKKFVSIVKVQGSYLVLGISENSITLLKELDSLEEENNDTEISVKPKFSEIFKQNLGMK